MHCPPLRTNRQQVSHEVNIQRPNSNLPWTPLEMEQLLRTPRKLHARIVVPFSDDVARTLPVEWRARDAREDWCARMTFDTDSEGVDKGKN